MRGSRWVPPSISGTPQRRSKKPKVEVGGRQPQVAPERQLEPARQAPAVDRRDRRLRGGEPAEAHRPGRVLDVEVERLQVGAGAERLSAGPGEDQDAGAVVGLEALEALAQAGGGRARRPRCGAPAGRWSAPRRRRPVRNAPPPCRDRPTARRRALRRSARRTARCAPAATRCGIGRASRGTTRGVCQRRPAPARYCAPVAGRGRGRIPTTTGKARSRLGRRLPSRLGRPRLRPAPGQPKKRPGMALVACRTRSLRDQKLGCATFETLPPSASGGTGLSRSQEQLTPPH